MKAFLRENPTIAFGLGLPLLLVVVFLLISGIPALLVAPPQYDVLYTTDFYGNANGIQISVVNKKIQVVYQGTMQNYQQPRLWRYNPKTGGVKEIALMLPPGLGPTAGPITGEMSTKITPIEVPDLVGVTVDASSIAPDGYAFSAGESPYSGDIFSGLFGYSRYRNGAVLTKDGRSIRLPSMGGGDYYPYSARFIGWVTP
jgi:hypothetical protein